MEHPEDYRACGAHKRGEAIKGSVFDYTCEDCVLQFNEDDYPDNEKRVPPNKKTRIYEVGQKSPF